MGHNRSICGLFVAVAVCIDPIDANYGVVGRTDCSVALSSPEVFVANSFKTLLLLSLLGGLAMAIGGVLGGRGGLSIGLIIGLAMAAGSYWFSDKMAIKSARAVPADPAQFPEYYAIMEDLTARANMPMPSLYVTPNRQPNAFATGRNPNNAAVAVTVGLMDIMDWDEIRGVLAHELAHIENRDILVGSVAAAIAMAVTYSARMAMWGGMRGRNNQNPIATIATVILAPVAAAFIKSAISRTREFKADASAARLMGDAEPLARALEKLGMASGRIPAQGVRPEQASHYIVNPFGASTQSNFGGGFGGFGKMFSTHPPLEARVAALRAGDWA